MAVTSADPRSGERAVRPVRSVTSPGRFWRTVLAYGGVYFVIMALGYVIVEPYAGGCMFIIGLMFYLTTLAALSWLYSGPSLETHYWFFTRGIAFSLPWLVVNGALAGYTAQAIARPPASVGQS